MEVGYYLPRHIAKTYGVFETRWAVIRNTYAELIDTTKVTFQDWFPWARWVPSTKMFYLEYPGTTDCPAHKAEYLFRSCDREEDMKKFKSLELTGYWIDESIEIREAIKKMIKGRDGRKPKAAPFRYGVETTNPPNIEHPLYRQYEWQAPPPGPPPKGHPLIGHKGWWQPPGENVDNLRPGYYDDLRNDYADSPDWIDMYIDGKPGIILKGRSVMTKFVSSIHVSKHPLVWDEKRPLYMGWDDSGNIPAAVLAQVVGPLQIQFLREFCSDKDNLVDFGLKVSMEIAQSFPSAHITHWGDPAGEEKHSDKDGNMTSNAMLLRQECQINVQPSEQNPIARIQAMDLLFGRRDGILIDPSMTRFIDGLMGGYYYPDRPGFEGEPMEAPAKNRYAHVQEAAQYLIVKLFAAGRSEERQLITNPKTYARSYRDVDDEYDWHRPRADDRY